MKILTRVLRVLRLGLAGPTTKELQSYARGLREAAAHYRLKHFPEILNEPEPCRSCGRPNFILMRPSDDCGECWKALLIAGLERFKRESLRLVPPLEIDCRERPDEDDYTLVDDCEDDRAR